MKTMRQLIGPGKPFPTKKALAEAAGISKQAVGFWQPDNHVPAERALAVSRGCNFAVTPHQLRPDMYPNPDDGLPRDSDAAA